MIPLGHSRVSGAFPVSSSSDAPTLLCTVPESAGTPAEITVRNTNALAVMYLRWRESGSGTLVKTTDFGIYLGNFEGFTWNNPPRGAELVALSSVAGALIAVDANWCNTDVEELT